MLREIVVPLYLLGNTFLSPSSSSPILAFLFSRLFCSLQDSILNFNQLLKASLKYHLLKRTVLANTFGCDLFLFKVPNIRDIFVSTTMS